MSGYDDRVSINFLCDRGDLPRDVCSLPKNRETPGILFTQLIAQGQKTQFGFESVVLTGGIRNRPSDVAKRIWPFVNVNQKEVGPEPACQMNGCADPLLRVRGQINRDSNPADMNGVPGKECCYRPFAAKTLSFLIAISFSQVVIRSNPGWHSWGPLAAWRARLSVVWQRREYTVRVQRHSGPSTSADSYNPAAD